MAWYLSQSYSALRKSSGHSALLSLIALLEAYSSWFICKQAARPWTRWELKDNNGPCSLGLNINLLIVRTGREAVHVRNMQNVFMQDRLVTMVTYMLIGILEGSHCNPHNIIQSNITEQDSSVQYFVTHELYMQIQIMRLMKIMKGNHKEQ